MIARVQRHCPDRAPRWPRRTNPPPSASCQDWTNSRDASSIERHSTAGTRTDGGWQNGPAQPGPAPSDDGLRRCRGPSANTASASAARSASSRKAANANRSRSSSGVKRRHAWNWRAISARGSFGSNPAKSNRRDERRRAASLRPWSRIASGPAALPHRRQSQARARSKPCVSSGSSVTAASAAASACCQAPRDRQLQCDRETFGGRHRQPFGKRQHDSRRLTEG